MLMKLSTSSITWWRISCLSRSRNRGQGRWEHETSRPTAVKPGREVSGATAKAVEHPFLNMSLPSTASGHNILRLLLPYTKESLTGSGGTSRDDIIVINKFYLQ
ncbi:unnamed protein product [Macrosiphum euphorbiae]|uniref:Uncharacterized protein n=1 Tax=Macrosiphum euphorbiae TaxID=13131 RepID=A0AAV0X4Z4_9HEMI|nr:unnamed protein product [Macrosiphum euphorbiae]